MISCVFLHFFHLSHTCNSLLSYPVKFGRQDFKVTLLVVSPSALRARGRRDNEYRHTEASVWHGGI